jgi:hypothetical protein
MGWGAPAGYQAPQPQLPQGLQNWLSQNGWTAPTGNNQQQSAMSTGAPPWAQALSGGYNLPSMIGQPSIPFASAQQWNSFMPQEQQAILSTAQSVGIDPSAYQQQMFAGFPEWGAPGGTGFQSY